MRAATGLLTSNNVKRALWLVHDRLRYGRKYAHELSYWMGRWYSERKGLSNAHYERLMLSIAGESDARFLNGKVVADFGCGPRGSLCWATAAKERIGIDVLAHAYRRFGIERHNMRYVQCTERSVPLPANSVDVLFTLNAMDHVDSFVQMSREVVRVLGPCGEFIGSLNLDEPPTTCEPQTLTEDVVREHLLNHLEVVSYRTAPRGPAGDEYRYLDDGKSTPRGVGPRFLWVRARKPATSTKA